MTTAQSPPREDLCRSATFELTRADDEGGDGLTLEGYGAVFDSVTEIDSWEGSFEEVIARGAFRKSLRERTPRMQFDHGFHPLIGSIPIGRYTTVEEDQRGLHVIGRLSDNWLVEPVRDAISDGGVEGMSFRFSVVRDEWRDKDGKLVKPEELFELLWMPGDRSPLRRTLKEIKVSEVGPVVWPAYDDTTVGVRSKVTIDLGRLADPDQRRTLARAVFLADAASRSQPQDAPPDGHPSDQQPSDAPRANEPADGHADDAPPATEPSGEHPSSRPANPTERAALIRAEYRARLDRLLVITQSKRTGENPQ
jgi:HK97 family phage prohead protease